MSEDIERTLCQLPQVHVFKIPARKTAEGHRASDWPKDPSWTGKLKIVAKGSTAAIILMDEANKVFATCHVTNDSAVERTLDSGRYFVLRITNETGRHAFIGIAFNERNDSFDFNVALSEFKSEQEREAKAKEFFEKSTVSQDFSLKEGDKIKIKLSHKKKSDESDEFHQPVAAFPTKSNSTTSAFNADPFATRADPFSSSVATSDPWANDPFATSGAPNNSKNNNQSSSLLDF